MEVTVWTREQYDADKQKKKLAAEQRANEMAEADKSTGQAMKQIVSNAFDLLTRLNPGDLAIQVKDPNHKLIKIEFVNANKTRINDNGRSSMGPREEQISIYHLAQELPEDVAMLIHVKTEKAVMGVPFALKDVNLP